MRNKLFLLLAVIGLLSLPSCLQDHPDVEDVAKEIKVTASISGHNKQSSIKTRAKNDSWETGDAIGIFMKKQGETLALPALIGNAKYVSTDGTINFTPAAKFLFFPFDKSKVDFIAYYPYTDKLNGVEYAIDISDQSNLSNIDLLYSDNVKDVNNTSESIDFSFKHQLANVILEFSLKDTEVPLTGLKAEISPVFTQATFILSDGTIKEETAPNKIAFNVSENGKTARAILLPISSLQDKRLTITYDKLSYILEIDKFEKIKSFDKNIEYTYNILIAPAVDAVIIDTKSSIEDWIKGPTENITATDGIPVAEEEEEEVTANDSVFVGDGTQANPYTIAQAKEINIVKKVWIKGYIVGAYGLGALSSENFVPGKTKNGTQGNIAIADTFNETKGEMVFPIDLNTGFASAIQKPLNIYENPDNLSKVVSVFCDISIKNGILCIINVTQAELEGKLYTKQ